MTEEGPPEVQKSSHDTGTLLPTDNIQGLSEVARVEATITPQHRNEDTGQLALPLPQSKLTDPPFILAFNQMFVHDWGNQSSHSFQLWNIAQAAEGLSGRSLRKLPFIALALHTYGEPCTIDEGLAALSTSVNDIPRTRVVESCV
jgi:hypothetical protein